MNVLEMRKAGATRCYKIVPLVDFAGYGTTTTEVPVVPITVNKIIVSNNDCFKAHHKPFHAHKQNGLWMTLGVLSKVVAFEFSKQLDDENYQFDNVQYCAVAALNRTMITSNTTSLMCTNLSFGSSIKSAKPINMTTNDRTKDHIATHVYLKHLAEARYLNLFSILMTSAPSTIN